MRADGLLIAFLVVGCSDVANTFEVLAPEARSAELHLCGKATELRRSGARFSTVRKITCEGAGEITIRFADRPPASCRVGYVTPGAVQDFQFEVDGLECRDAGERASNP